MPSNFIERIVYLFCQQTKREYNPNWRDQERDWKLVRVVSALNNSKFLYGIKATSGIIYNPLYPSKNIVGEIVREW